MIFYFYEIFFPKHLFSWNRGSVYIFNLLFTYFLNILFNYNVYLAIINNVIINKIIFVGFVPLNESYINYFNLCLIFSN